MIIQLSAKYQFCAKHTAATSDGKITNRARLSIESEKVPPFANVAWVWLMGRHFFKNENTNIQMVLTPAGKHAWFSIMVYTLEFESAQ